MTSSVRKSSFRLVQSARALQSFWPYPGNAKGIADAIAARGAVDLNRREQTANCIRSSMPKSASPPEGLKLLLKGRSGYRRTSITGRRRSSLFHYKILSALRWRRNFGHGHTSDCGILDGVRRPRFRRDSRTHAPDGSSFEWTPERMEQAPWTHHVGCTSRTGVAGLVSSDTAIHWCRPPSIHALAHRVRHWLNEWFGGEDLVVIDGDDADLKASAYAILPRSGTVMVLPQPFKWPERSTKPSGHRPLAGAGQQPVCIGGEWSTNAGRSMAR